MAMAHKHKYKPQKSKRSRNTVPAPSLTHDEMMQLCDLMSSQHPRTPLKPIALEPLSHSEKKKSSRKKSQRRMRNRKLQKKRGCSTPHKIPHSSRKDAEEAIASQLRSMRPGHELPVRVYLHDGKGGCGFWHTTSLSEQRHEEIVAQHYPQHVLHTVQHDQTKQSEQQRSTSRSTEHPLFVALREHNNNTKHTR